MIWFLLFLCLYVLPWNEYESVFGALIYAIITPAILPSGLISLALFVAGIFSWFRESQIAKKARVEGITH